MSNFKLNLPTDIPWKRICVTEDMVDRVVCDANLPPKWHSSLAVFKYSPEDEFQSYLDYKITYLKVTATITGYQPLDDEIQGEIDWDGLNVGTREGITELLTSYYPCNGAILQVVVGPKGNNPKIQKKDYPFFMDFEPKKRELYELATDTKEKQSRSIDTVNISKSAGQTESQEVMDIDMGGGGFGHEAKVFGTGGGFNVQGSQGQWGTKQLNSQESMELRSTDSGQEKRESYSFTTHISQMYNQLNSYHIGTNRAVFFVQPRPHVLEEPSGFVRGPRAVEGIQEFFLVVAQPRNQEDFCVSLKLDTAHLTTIPIMDYERRTVLSDSALAVANLPSTADTVETRQVRCVVDYLWPIPDDDIFYKKFVKTVNNSIVFQAPNGFRIENRSDAINSRRNGFSNVSQSADGRTLTINAEARSSVWRQDEGDGWFAECPDTLNEITGRVERRLRINLISTSRTKQVGERDVLLITTRGLCCCPESGVFKPGVLVTGTKAIPDYFGGTLRYDSPTYVHKDFPGDTKLESTKQGEETSGQVMYIGERALNTKTNLKEATADKDDCSCKERPTYAKSPLDKKVPIRKANEMIGFIKDEILKSMVNPLPENTPKPFIQTDFFAKRIQTIQSSVRNGKANLHRKIGKELPKAICARLESKFRKKADEITVYDVMTLRNHELGRLGNMNSQEVARFKLSQLGIKLNDKGEGKNEVVVVEKPSISPKESSAVTSSKSLGEVVLRLKELAELKRQKMITDDEYTKMKGKLIK